MSVNLSLSHIVFFQVRDNASKIERIISCARTHFKRKEPILFFVDDEKALTYLDELLWRHPPCSFLPHEASDNPTKALIAITRVKENLNDAKVAFNLSSTPVLLPDFKLIYELEDLTTLAKKKLGAMKFDAYKAARCLIEARE